MYADMKTSLKPVQGTPINHDGVCKARHLPISRHLSPNGCHGRLDCLQHHCMSRTSVVATAHVTQQGFPMPCRGSLHIAASGSPYHVDQAQRWKAKPLADARGLSWPRNTQQPRGKLRVVLDCCVTLHFYEKLNHFFVFEQFCREGIWSGYGERISFSHSFKQEEIDTWFKRLNYETAQTPTPRLPLPPPPPIFSPLTAHFWNRPFCRCNYFIPESSILYALYHGCHVGQPERGNA